MELRYFLGANSAEGFSSRYSELQPPETRRLTRILKGGPGCGKSTLMKKAAACAAARGLDTEQILCSSDPDSLDGIVIPALGYALVDGTAPHVVEPKLCGAGEVYLNLGRGYDTAAMSSCGGTLREIQACGAQCYTPATAALRAAADLEPMLEQGRTPVLSASLAASICDRELPVRHTPGVLRRCFLSGHTPAGLLCCWDTVAQCCPRVIALRGTRQEISTFLGHIAEAALARGWEARLCHSPLLPMLAEHLLLPALGLAFVSDTPQLPYSGARLHTLGVTPAGDAAALQQSLLDAACAHLRRAKEYHDLLERACAPYVDFSTADQAAKECCAELELLADAAC